MSNERQNAIISTLIDHLDESINNSEETYHTLKYGIGLSVEEIIQYWEAGQFTEHPFQVFGFYYDEDENLTGFDEFFGEFDTLKEAEECMNSINTIPNDDAKYMTLQIELVVEDADGFSTLDILDTISLERN